jgi:hypothetical protein
MMMSEARSWAFALVMTVSLFPLGCGAERPAATERSTAVQATPGPAAEAVVRTGVIREIGPRVTDVAMLKRLPDGTYERTCGPPDPETRTMMEAVMRARMGSPR